VGEPVINRRIPDANNMMHAFLEEYRSARKNQLSPARGSTAGAGCLDPIHGSRVVAGRRGLTGRLRFVRISRNIHAQSAHDRAEERAPGRDRWPTLLLQHEPAESRRFIVRGRVLWGQLGSAVHDHAGPRGCTVGANERGQRGQAEREPGLERF